MDKESNYRDREILPKGFVFSQSSLQDFMECARRFQLRYIYRLAWPALETQEMVEAERLLKQGNRFHQLVQQQIIGVAVERLESSITDEDLARWWENYRAYATQTLGLENLQAPQNLFPEVNLSAPIGDYRLVAKYDLLVKKLEGQWLIVDWKTSRKRPKSEWLRSRMQTYVYPFLFVQAGGELHEGMAIEPEMVEMIYWFSEHPQAMERIAYNADKYEADQSFLEGIIKRIVNMEPQAFMKTEHGERCAYCVYRSLCERGLQAGALAEYEGSGESEAGIEFELDFEEIAEIEF
jgi:CRISPR/Cas system-associated exonuclease Cas4 (RecB family)